MANFAYPTARIFQPMNASVWIDASVLTIRSPLTKSTRVRDLHGDKWRMTLEFAPVARRAAVDDQAEREAFWNRVGLFNTITIWHPARPIPRGTMRGAPTLAAPAAQGATTLSISGSGTLLVGDMIGVGGELFQVVAASGSTYTVTPKVKQAKSSGSAVVWNMPTAIMAVQAPVEIPYVPGYSPGFTVDLSER